MSDDVAASRFSALSDAELKRIAAENRPIDPRERAALVTEMHRRASTLRAAAAEPPAPPKVVVTDIDMPFGSMVSFMAKWSIASIPAFLLLAVIGLFVAAVFGAMFGSGR
jgi:hypothetical protein